MREIDPGHRYELTQYDGDGVEVLQFVKREGDTYPGNVGTTPGTNCQEVARALIKRLQYVNGQIPDWRNESAIDCCRTLIRLLESRAAERHGRGWPELSMTRQIELMPTCPQCGHIGCDQRCRA